MGIRLFALVVFLFSASTVFAVPRGPRASLPAVAENPCDPATVDSIKLFQDSLDPVAFAEKQQNVLKWTDRWENFLGRKMSRTEFNRSKLVDQVYRMAKFDRPYLLIKFATPKAFPVSLSYELYTQDAKILESIQTEIADTATTATRKTALETTLVQVEQRIKENVTILSDKLDEYEGMMGLLKKLALNDDQQGKNAKLVLEKLESRNLLKDYLTSAGLSSTVTPELADLHRVVDRFPAIKLSTLKKIRDLEAWTLLLAVAPTQTVADLVLRNAARIPWLDQGSFRSWVESILSERNRFIYYPDIQRIVNGSGTPEERLQMLEILNAGTNNVLLVTFKRRIDLATLWADLKAAAAARPDQAMTTKMTTAETVAVPLDDLVLDGKPGAFTIVTRTIDAGITSTFAYWGLYHHFPFFPGAALPHSAINPESSRKPASVQTVAPEPIPEGFERLQAPMDEWDEYQMDRMVDALGIALEPLLHRP